MKELAEVTCTATGFKGKITYDTAMPTGQLGRTFDTQRVRATKWEPKHALHEGLTKTVAWFEANRSNIRER